MSPKRRGIRALLKRLPMADRGWVVEDHWECDLCAIGVARADDRRRLVYVSTWQHSPGRYSYICEVPGEGPDPSDYVHGEQGEDVDEAQLLDALVRHLG